MSLAQRIDYHKLRIKKLDNSTDLSGFSCSIEDVMGLDDFIHKQALIYQKENLGVTYLFLYRKQIVGFVTLAMGEIQIKKSKRFIPFSVPFKDFPALLIGRLAVDNKFRKRDIGRNICLWVLGFAKTLSVKMGCRFITLLTKGKTVEFYEECGFEAIDRTKKKVIMFKGIPPLKT